MMGLPWDWGTARWAATLAIAAGVVAAALGGLATGAPTPTVVEGAPAAQVGSPTSTPTAGGGPLAVSGQLMLQRVPTPPAPAYETGVLLRLYPADSYQPVPGQPDARTPLAVASVRTDSGGTFSASVAGIAPSAYAVNVKPAHALSVEVGHLDLSAASGTPVPFGVVREGDATGDDAVTILDFSLLATAFNRVAGEQGFDSQVDFNQDGAVTILDFSLLAASFNLRGPQPPMTRIPTPTASPTASPTPTATATPTASSTPTATLTPSPTATATLAPGRDAYGVILSGSSVGSETELRTLLDKLRLRSWYVFGQSDLNPPGYAQVFLVRVQGGVLAPDAATLTARAQRWPGSFWMIGNEPNVRGQDLVAAEAYARLYKEARDALLAGDPTAKLVAPNVFNWNEWQGRGRDFVVAFRQAFVNAYGTQPPVDVWGIHSYDLNWPDLPLDNYVAAQNDLMAFRAYLDGTGEQGKPIWVTELGIIWAYGDGDPVTQYWDGLRFERTNLQCQSPGVDQYGPYCVEPVGNYRMDLVVNYILKMMGWLEQNRTSLNIQRWFLYATYPPPEVYSSTPTTIRLFDGPSAAASLTAAGEAYRGP